MTNFNTALYAKDGFRTEYYRLELIDKHNIKKKDLQLKSGQITVDANNEVKRTASLVFLNDETLKMTSDRLKVIMGIYLQDGTTKEFELGVFLIIKSKEQYINNTLFYECHCMDESVILQQSTFKEPKLFLKGTNYTDVLQHLIVSCGLTKINLITRSRTLPVLQNDLVLDNSLSKLAWFNKLAEESGFNNLYVDNDGYFLIKRYTEPNGKNVSISYKDDELSVLSTDVEMSEDIWNVPNVFIGVVSSPDVGELKSIFVNNDPSNRFSLQHRGFEVTKLCVIDNIANQAELDAYIRRIAFTTSQVEQEIQFKTLNMPFHTIEDVIYIRHNKIEGIFRETAYQINLTAGSLMTHTAKRLVILE